MTFFFLATGAAPFLKPPLVEQIALEHGPVPGDETAPCVLGYLFGGAGAVQDDLRKYIVRPAAYPEIQVVLDLPRNHSSVRALGGKKQCGIDRDIVNTVRTAYVFYVFSLTE